MSGTFGWMAITRLGLVQCALGAIVVLATSTLNRVMVVELTLPALLPGLLVGLHYVVQLMRPRIGHGSDLGRRRTPWIVGGLGVLALGCSGAALAVAAWPASPLGALLLAVLSFVAIGLGVGAAGTTLLVLLATHVAPGRRAAAATLVWLMMILGCAVSATLAGQALAPYTPARLVAVVAAVCALAWLAALAALYRLEPPLPPASAVSASAPPLAFRAALAEVWAEPAARRFTLFVGLAMFAYSAQDLILEPFAGAVFGYTPGQSTSLSGVQHGGVLAGMLLAAAAGRRWGSLRAWTIGGCLASALALLGLAAAGLAGPGWPLRTTVGLLGAANGAFTVAALASMMQLASAGARPREGLRLGLWGAAQAVAFALGGLAGGVASDLAQRLFASAGVAYAAVFLAQAVLFLLAARWAGKATPQRAAAQVPEAPLPASLATAAARASR